MPRTTKRCLRVKEEKPQPKAAPQHVLPIASKLQCGAELMEARIRNDPSLKRYLVTTALSIFFTLGAHSASLFYWAGTISNRVQALEKSIDRLEHRLDGVESRLSASPNP